MPNWRLGLDMGTNSIGWAVIELKDGVPGDLLDMGVRVFSDGRDPQSNESLNLNRRTARLMRRQKYRRIRRQLLIRNALCRAGYFPQNPEEQEKLKLLNPYELRVKALNEELSKFELGRVLLHLAGRRGFKSNRKMDKEDKEETVLKQKMSKFKTMLKENNYRTLGEYLYRLSEQNKTITKDIQQHHKGAPTPALSLNTLRFKANVEYFPTRDLYIEEWNKIRQKQETYHPQLPWDEIFRKTYYQRPLKPQVRGLCFFTREPRAWQFLPTIMNFRIYQELNNLEFWTKQSYKQKSRLNAQQIQVLAEALEGKRPAKVKGSKSKMALGWKEIKQLLKMSDDVIFNLEKDPQRYDGLKVNWINYTMMSEDYFGDAWFTITEEDRDAIIEKLYTETNEDELKNYLQQFTQNEELIAKLLNFDLGLSTTASVSLRFAREVLVYLKQGYRYYEAGLKAGYHVAEDSGFENGEREQLPYYGEILWDMVIRRVENRAEKPDLHDEKYLEKAIDYYGRIGNPTVHIALNQLRKLVNKLIRRFGKPAEIVVEMGRELKQTKKQRDEASKIIAKNKRNKDRIKGELEKVGIQNPSDRDYKKYILWEELGRDQSARCCLYTGRPISLNQLYNGEVEIEHILPYSRTMLDGMDNLTVSFRNANAFKGNRSPWEAFGTSPQGYDWQQIFERAKRAFKDAGDADKTRRKYFLRKLSRFDQHAMDNFDLSQSDFADRQLTDNHFISKATRRYLSAILPKEKIWNTVGSVTDVHRRIYGLNKLLQKTREDSDGIYAPKNRHDHRHHALDAYVIAQIDRSVVQKINTLSGRGQISPYLKSETVFDGVRIPMKDVWLKLLPQPAPWNVLEQRLRQMIPSLRVNHKIQGAFFLETALGKRKTLRSKPTVHLKKEDIEDIVSPKVRSLFEETLKETKNFDRTKQLVAQSYPQVYLSVSTFVTRKPVSSLEVSKDRQISYVYEPKILETFQEFYEENSRMYLNQKGEVDEDKILQAFAERYLIRRLRIETHSQEAYQVPSAPYKYYQLQNFLCVDVWQIPEKNQKFRYEGNFISLWDAMLERVGNHRLRDKKPHPAAKKLGRYYKSDVLHLIPRREGLEELWVQIKGFSTKDNKMDIYPVWASGDLADWAKNINPKFFQNYWNNALIGAPEKRFGQNFKSINVIFKDFLVHKVFIDVDGQIRGR